MKSHQKSQFNFHEEPSPLLLLVLLALLCLSLAFMLSFGGELQGTTASRNAGTAPSVAQCVSDHSLHESGARSWLAVAA